MKAATKRCVIVLICCAAALILSAILSAEEKTPADLAKERHLKNLYSNDPYMVIPKTARPPVIDGKLADGEWDGAAKITGFVNGSIYLVDTQPFFYVTYDDKNLYVAYQGPIPERVKANLHTEALHGLVQQSKTEFDTNVDADDSVEVVIVPKYPEDTWYRYLSNNLNTHYDFRVAPGMDIKLDWNPAWKSATSISIEEWVMEMLIPLDSTYAPVPETGTVWGMNFRRLWRQLKKGMDAWSAGTSLKGTEVKFWRYWYTGNNVGQVRFGGENPVFVRMNRVSGFYEATPVIEMSFVNGSGEKKEIAIHIETDAGDIKKDEKISVAAGGTLIYRTTLPYYQKQTLDILVKHYPSFNKVLLEMNLSLLKKHPLEKLTIDVSLIDAKTKKTVMEKENIRPTTYYPSVDLDTQKVPEGAYEIVMSFLVDNESVAEEKKDFEKKPLPEWFGNKIGVSDKVPPPYTEMQTKGNVISVWGRTYDFTDSLFPKSITTQGKELLASPIALVVEKDGKRYSSSDGKANFSITSAKAAHVEWKATQAIAGVDISIDGWMDYDGFMWLTLSAKSDAKEKIDSMYLKIPFAKEFSSLVNNYDYSLRTTGKIHPLKKGCDPLWVGNEAGGLQWLAETSLTWKLKKNLEAVELVPAARGALIKINFIDHPVELSRPLGLSFGLVATPIRPPTPGNLEELCDMQPVVWGYGNYQPHTTDWGNPMAWMVTVAGYGHGFRKDRANKFYPDGRQGDSGPYTMFESCTAGDSEPGKKLLPTLDYFFYEWAANASELRKEGPKGLHCSPASKSWQDFFLWCYLEAYKRRRYTGLYYDVSMPTVVNNIYGGAGMKINGGAQATTTHLGARTFAKRLYTMLRMREPEGSIRYHMSGQLNGALLGFLDRIVDGENFASILSLKKPRNYEHLSLATFRAEYMGSNFGPVGYWLPQNRRALNSVMAREKLEITDIYPDPDRETRWVYGICLLHNTGLWPAYLPGSAAPLIEDMQKYSISNKRYNYYPYWNQNIAKLKPADDNLVCSVYLSKVKGPRGPLLEGKDPENNDKIVELTKRALFVLFNNTDWKGNAKISVNWKALGIDPSKAALSKASFGEKITLKGNKLIVPIGARDVRLIAVGE